MSISRNVQRLLHLKTPLDWVQVACQPKQVLELLCWAMERLLGLQKSSKVFGIRKLPFGFEGELQDRAFVGDPIVVGVVYNTVYFCGKCTFDLSYTRRGCPHHNRAYMREEEYELVVRSHQRLPQGASELLSILFWAVRVSETLCPKQVELKTYFAIRRPGGRMGMPHPSHRACCRLHMHVPEVIPAAGTSNDRPTLHGNSHPQGK